ncbi:uncharacterized protein [Lepisosteus oculatus]|uniref:uncharacterized protein isoform X2 n=1 Tax=Lepisosteus oculatus TaxID=7918 RepID=UPI00073FAD45|nr:PREDICTED: uncharacterized protein LOC107078490 isoform X2 [Lepisosteus oculatus]
MEGKFNKKSISTTGANTEHWGRDVSVREEGIRIVTHRERKKTQTWAEDEKFLADMEQLLEEADALVKREQRAADARDGIALRSKRTAAQRKRENEEFLKELDQLLDELDEDPWDEGGSPSKDGSRAAPQMKETAMTDDTDDTNDTDQDLEKLMDEIERTYGQPAPLSEPDSNDHENRKQEYPSNCSRPESKGNSTEADHIGEDDTEGLVSAEA